MSIYIISLSYIVKKKLVALAVLPDVNADLGILSFFKVVIVVWNAIIGPITDNGTLCRDKPFVC